jgi:OmpA-OmpF porin, OOP family
MNKRTFCAVVLMSWVPLSEADSDCALASRYYDLSKKATSDYKQRDAYEFLERAVEVCPTSYQYLQELGEAAAGFGEELNARAAEAYVSAYALAEDAPEQARSIGRYAELLFHTNNPNALSYIHQAKNLDPDNAWIAALAKQIDERSLTVTADGIKRGLGDMAFKPLILQNRPEPEQQPGQGGSGKSPKDTDVQVQPVGSVQIPLNFEFNSTRLDRQTQTNIGVLASTLAEADFAGKRFVFVGHADRRGTADANMILSMQRAVAIFNAVVALQPSLAGRISTEGRGSEQPLSLGNTEADYRVNRRLEVISK